MKNNRCSKFLQSFTAITCGAFLFCSSFVSAEIIVETLEEKKKEDIAKIVFVHHPEGLYDDYASILKKYVDDKGLVDYAGLKADRKELDDFIESLSKVDLDAYRMWYDKEKLALWINAYNAFTLQIIIDHYPIKASFPRSMMYPKNSIQQIARHAEKFYLRIVNFSMNLDNISNSVLRDQFHDPRIHVALSSASSSRAPLLNVPYDGDVIDEQLKQQAKTFFSQKENYSLDQENKVVYFSKILKWYAKEFVGKYEGKNIKREGEDWSKGILDYLIQHISNEEEIKFLENEEYDIKFLEYDWSLNEQKK